MLNGNELREDITSIRNALLEGMVRSKDRFEIGKRNAELVHTIERELRHYEMERNDLRNMTNYIVREYKNIEQYLIDKKENSMEALEMAVKRAGLIVPDADTAGIHLSIKDKSATVLSKNGQDINLREGSAFRAIMGMLMRYTLIKFQPDSLQIIWLDEAFSTLSDTTSTLMREFIEAFKDDILIVGIEQRNVLFEGLDKVVYTVVKDDNNETIIRRGDY